MAPQARYAPQSRLPMKTPALKSTVFRAELTISDLDREVYETFSLTLARHPSETDERMMIRLLALPSRRMSD